MRALGFGLGALGFGILAVAVPARAQRASQVVANVDAVYSRLSGFRASFTQTYQVAAYNTTKTETGTMNLARPSQMSFAYTNGNRVSCAGSQCTVFNAQANQTITQSVSQSSFSALGFLTGRQTLASAFSFSSMQSIPNGYVLVGTPTTPSPVFTAALFYVDAGTWQVRRIVLVDGQRNQNRFDLANPVFAVAPPVVNGAQTPSSN